MPEQNKPQEFPDLYPKADHRFMFRLSSVGTFQGDKPVGVTVHYTADRDIERVVRVLKERELGYHLMIARDGTVFQCAKLRVRLWHAGKAVWRNRSPNREHIAVALLSWGLVEDVAADPLRRHFETWNGLVIPPADVAERTGNLGGDKAWWDAATPHQEAALSAVLSWLVAQGIDPEDVCGHDECALPSGRKIDPGGVLLKPMRETRAWLGGVPQGPYVA